MAAGYASQIRSLIDDESGVDKRPDIQDRRVASTNRGDALLCTPAGAMNGASSGRAFDLPLRRLHNRFATT
jgi:hypothetical protein